MSTMAEIQVRLGSKPQGNHLPGSPAFKASLLEAEGLWGGPLPGWVTGIQINPLRVEIAGQPPVRILLALMLPLGCKQMAKFWQLKVKERLAGVYHWRLGWCPMPAMPPGVSLASGEHPCIRQTVCWNTSKVVAWRLYVEEWIEGIIPNTWPTMADISHPAEGWDQLYALDFDASLQVNGINRYDYPIDSCTPSMLEQGRMRRLTMGKVR